MCVCFLSKQSSIRHVEVDRTGRFFLLLSFWVEGEGAPAIIRRAGAMFGSCGLLFTSAISVASHRWISSAWRQDCVFHVCHGEESALKGGRTPIFEGPYVVSAFWSWLGFSLGGPGVLFLFFLGEGGVSFSLFLFLLGREGVSIENFRAGEGVH